LNKIVQAFFISWTFNVHLCQQATLSLQFFWRGKSGLHRVSIAGNARPSWGEDKCNRKYVQFGCSETR